MEERRMGLDASVCITPEAISPESVSTGISTAVITVRKFTPKRPASTNVVSIIRCLIWSMPACLTISRWMK